MPQVTILSTFSAEPIQKSMHFWTSNMGFDFDFTFAPYNQVFQQLINPQMSLSKNSQGSNLILICLEDWVCVRRGAGSSPRQLPQDSSESILRLTQIVDEFTEALKNSAAQIPGPHLVIFCPPTCARMENSQKALFLRVFREEEERIVESVQGIDNLSFVTTSEMQQLYPVKNFYDPYTDQSAHVPFTDEFFAALGTVAVRRLVSLYRPPFKVIVLDCDQTLWGGVCGEDGPENISIEEPFYGLQTFMFGQYQAGMLLSLCSKNQEFDVLDVFAKRQDMPLSLEQIVSWRINWQPKSENIKALAQELNLGLDSFIFVDDNPIECAEVRANCPEVLTLQLPKDISKIPTFLQHVWVFDRRTVTAEDKTRTGQYQQNIRREQIREHTDSLESFLEKLQLNIGILPIQTGQLGRVSQLTQRTNQFNLTTRRWTEGEIQQWVQQLNQHVLVVEVSDRFGDYGLVGAIFYRIEPQYLEVDTFLLSCRALARRVEHHMLEQLGGIAEQCGLKSVQVLFRRSSKNQPALDFLCNVASKTEKELSSQQEVPDRQDEIRFIFSRNTLQELSSFVAVDTVQDYQANSTPISSNKEAHPIEGKSHSVEILPNLSKVMERISRELYSAKKIQQCITSRRTPRPALQQVYAGTRTKMERLLKSIWIEVLNIEEIGVNDNLEELGGSSVHVIQIHSRISTLLSASGSMMESVSVAMVFQYPTIKTLAEFLERGHNDQEIFVHSVQSRVALQQAVFSQRRDARRIF